MPVCSGIRMIKGKTKQQEYKVIQSKKRSNGNGRNESYPEKCAAGGFTLAELLVIVAIVAVLVAIAIPIFAKQLEKSRRAVDMANARNIIAAVSVGINSGDIQFDKTYAIGTDGSDKLANVAVIVGKTGMQAYASGNIRINGNEWSTGGGHARISDYLASCGIEDYLIKSRNAGTDGWDFFAVFIYSDGTVRVGSGDEKGYNDYNGDKFETHAQYWKTAPASNIEKAMGLRS